MWSCQVSRFLRQGRSLVRNHDPTAEFEEARAVVVCLKLPPNPKYEAALCFIGLAELRRGASRAGPDTEFGTASGYDRRRTGD